MKRTLLLALCGSLLFAASARADWTQFGGSTEHQFYTTDKLSAPLGVLWKYATMLYADKGGNLGGPVVSDGVVFFASKNRLLAVDAETGEKKWQVPDGENTDPNLPYVTATPVVSGDFLYVPDANGNVSAYKTADGTLLWSFRTGATVRSSPLLVGDALYFGSDDDYVYCIDARSGDLRWKSNERGRPMPLSDDAIGAPVYYSGVIYINSGDMKLWAFQADSGKLIWVQRMSAPALNISPVVYNNKVYMAGGNTIYQFRLRGGGYRPYPLNQWMENDISTTPIITEHAWYVGDGSGYFEAFTPGGKPLLNADGGNWKVKVEGKPLGTPIMTADTIYVSTDKGFVYGIDTAKGKITWTYRTEAPKGMDPLFAYYPIHAPLAVTAGRLYSLGDDGTLTCMTSDASDEEGPVLTAPKPSRGAVINGTPPVYVAAYVWDEGTGINPDTIELYLNGQLKDPDPLPYNERVVGQRKGWVYDPMKRMITYYTPKAAEGKPEQPLLDGPQKVQIQVADWRGNVSSLEWSFYVDHNVPKPVAPTKQARPGAQGSSGSPGGYPGGGGSPGGYPGASGSGSSGMQPGGRGSSRSGGYGQGSQGSRGGSGYGFGSGGGPGAGARGGGGRGRAGTGF